jgi:hypothetical protein
VFTARCELNLYVELELNVFFKLKEILRIVLCMRYCIQIRATVLLPVAYFYKGLHVVQAKTDS